MNITICKRKIEEASERVIALRAERENLRKMVLENEKALAAATANIDLLKLLIEEERASTCRPG